MLTMVAEEIELYAEAHTTNPGALVEELAAATQAATTSHQMMSGRTVGGLLQTLIHVGGVRRVLEIGTFTGYSALCMAAALPEDGELITCDVDPEMTSIARRFWKRSPHGKKINLILGPALDTIKTLKGKFDLIFIDADKPNYPAYYRSAIKLLGPRGVVAIDNVLWGGRVLSPDDESGRAIAALNDLIAGDRTVEHVLLTVRDGVLLVRKKG